MNTYSPQGFAEQPYAAKVSVREVLYRYLINLPLFILSMVICTGAAYIYLRYTDKTYLATSQILVGGNTAVSANNTDLVTQGLYGVRAINIDNELELLRSKKLLERVVKKRMFNIRYFNLGTIKKMELYNASPIQLRCLGLVDASRAWNLKITNLSNKGGKYQLNDEVSEVFNWNDTLNLQVGKIIIAKKYALQQTDDQPHLVMYESVEEAAEQIREKLTVKSFSSKTTIMSLSLESSNPSRAADILNLLGNLFSEQDVELKKEISINTLDFIDSRLRIVSKDLKSIDSSRGTMYNNPLFNDVSSEMVYYQDKYGNTEKRLEDAFVDTAVISLIEDYVKDSRNRFKKIYSPLGISDQSLMVTIGKYNEAITERDKAEFENTNDNIIMSALENKIYNLRNNVLVSIGNIKRAYALKIDIYNERNNEYVGKLGKIPSKTILEIELKKQKELKERLYLYLLQRREEIAIAAISTKSNYSSIDPASFSTVPIEPKEDQIINFALLLGLVIPIAFIYLLDLLNDKIISRNDLTNKTTIPIVGEISHLDGGNEMVVKKNRSIIAEQFRILRSNLQYIDPAENDTKSKTFLITSVISGEGKSFISTNLAGVLELTGKKVALLEFDLRKLKSLKLIKNEEFNKGITNFLIGQTDDINELVYTITDFPNLDVYKTGPLPPNPSELMISDRMELLFDKLKAKYDYIIIDSAPVGLVSDAFALNRFVDATIFIIRQRFSLKKQIELVNDLKENGKFKNIFLTVNDINLSGTYGYYDYGYSYGYQYNYGYGAYGNHKMKGNYFSTRNHNPYFNEKKKNFWNRIWRNQ